MPDESTTWAERLRAAAEELAATAGLELVDLELRGSGRNRTLRLFIDKPSGITHADCEQISRGLSARLDEDASLGPGRGAYILEVSSPGLDRRLVKAADFVRFSGQMVKITTRQPLGERRTFSGRLMGWTGEMVEIELDLGRKGRECVRIELDNIERAHLVPEW